MKVRVSRSNTPPKPSDCYHVDKHGPCMIVQLPLQGFYAFVVLETGVLLSSSRLSPSAPESPEVLLQLYDCRRINDPITLTPD